VMMMITTTTTTTPTCIAIPALTTEIFTTWGYPVLRKVLRHQSHDVAIIYGAQHVCLCVNQDGTCVSRHKVVTSEAGEFVEQMSSDLKQKKK